MRKYQCLFYGEGGKDKKFLYALIDLPQFKYQTSKWTTPSLDNTSGGSPQTILENCRRRISNFEYDLVLCFVDLDQLKSNFPKNWESQKSLLENNYLNYKIQIIWQMDNLEEEFSRVLGSNFGKHKINKLAKNNAKRFINSDYWKRIIFQMKEVEKKLDDNL